MSKNEGEIPDDVMLLAWIITAEHLTRGEKDVTKIVADAILRERKRGDHVDPARLSVTTHSNPV